MIPCPVHLDCPRNLGGAIISMHLLQYGSLQDWNGTTVTLIPSPGWSSGGHWQHSIPATLLFAVLPSLRPSICLILPLCCFSLMAQTVRNLPATREMRVWSLGQKISWRREWQPTAVFLPGESHEQRSPWGCKELDMTEQLRVTSLCLGLRFTMKTECVSLVTV